MNDELLVLSEEDLAFLRMVLEVFPVPESPLRFLDEEDREPADPGATFESLVSRGLFHESGGGATEELRARLGPVSECRARVSLNLRGETNDSEEMHEFFVTESGAVQYSHTDSGHAFGRPTSEEELAARLAAMFHTAPEGSNRELRLSAGDYLAFAVFARDVRGQDEEEPIDSMSVDEVLAYFDEPETPFVKSPNEDAWVESVDNLAKLRVLVKREHGYELHPTLHALARELTADRHSAVHRFDFLDDQWLMREVNLYPTQDTVYRLGTSNDGSVVIQELSVSGLESVLARIVSTLPNLLDPDAAPQVASAHG
ncbi:MAG: hypothetical protein AAFY60_00045 [Myxococcota bacterium]